MIAFSVPHSEVTCALRSDARDMGSELSESGATRVLGALGSAHSNRGDVALAAGFDTVRR